MVLRLAKLPREGRLLKQLTISKDLGEVDPSTVETEASHPSIPKVRVKIKVETSIL